MKRIGIFTTNSVNKLHPRIELQLRLLKENNYSVEIIRSKSKREGFLFEILNLFFLKYFKCRAINNFKKRLIDFDIIHIYDLQLLPLSKAAYRLNKKVIYETLDDNVYLNYHAISKKIFFLRILRA